MAGRICVWRYRDHSRDYSGFHLSADPAGATQLLKLLDSLAKARTPQIGNVVLDPVTPDVLAIPNNRSARSAIIAYRHWELIVDPKFPPEQLHFAVTNDRLRTQLSLIQVESLVAGVEDVRALRGDYAIGDEDEDRLWFWWQEGA
jgi:hypothetical protein